MLGSRYGRSSVLFASPVTEIFGCCHKPSRSRSFPSACFAVCCLLGSRIPSPHFLLLSLSLSRARTRRHTVTTGFYSCGAKGCWGGRCTRRSCAYSTSEGAAHARAVRLLTAKLSCGVSGDLRMVNGRQDYRSGSFRDKLGQKYSPRRRFSPGRDGRGRHRFQSDKLVQHDRGYSPSRSPVARRGKRKRQLDGESDASGSPRISDYAEDQIKDGKASAAEIDTVQEQLKQTQLDIEMFDEHKCQLEILLEEKAQEADKLSARTEDLERQLNKEQENYRRCSSNIKKFIKAYGHFSRAQEELKRSKSRLQRVCNQLDMDNLKPGNNEEDSSVQVTGEGEPSGDRHTNTRNYTHNRASPMKKRSRFERGTTEDTIVRPGRLGKHERSLGTSTRVDKLAQAELHISESENEDKVIEMTIQELIENDVQRQTVDDHSQKDISSSHAVVPSRKVRGSSSSHLLSSTSMAAHAVDDFIEAMEKEERLEARDANLFEDETDNNTGLAFLPPLPPKVTQSNYNQYQGEDDEVDVEADAHAGDADGNSEVEIEV